MSELIVPKNPDVHEIEQVHGLDKAEWLTSLLAEMGMVVSPHETQTLRSIARLIQSVGEQMVRSRLKSGLVLQVNMPTDKYWRLRYQFQMDLAYAYGALEAIGDLVGSALESGRLLAESERQVDEIGVMHDRIPLKMRQGEIAYLQGATQLMRNPDHPDIQPGSPKRWGITVKRLKLPGGMGLFISIPCGAWLNRRRRSMTAMGWPLRPVSWKTVFPIPARLRMKASRIPSDH